MFVKTLMVSTALAASLLIFDAANWTHAGATAATSGAGAGKVKRGKGGVMVDPMNGRRTKCPKCEEREPPPKKK
jgi:hypothetical protein